jgi:hypothetical protein
MIQDFKYILSDEGKDYICEKYFGPHLRQLFNNTLWYVGKYHDYNIYRDHNSHFYCCSKGLSIVFDKNNRADEKALSFFKKASEEELLIIDIIS